MTTTLTSQQRVDRMFARADQDRVPRHDHYWPDTIRRWNREGLVGADAAAREYLDGDLWPLCSIWPQPFPKRDEVIEEDAQTLVKIDAWGQKCRWWKHKSGTPDHLGWECDGRATWENRFKPAMQACPLPFAMEDVLNHARAGRSRDRWVYVTVAEPFEQLRRLVGDEAMLMAMVDEPDWVRDVAASFTDVELVHLRQVLNAGIAPDGLWIWGDMAYNHATLCSPAMYRELIWPDHQRMADFAHAHGMKAIYHTDGAVNGVLDLYLAAGFDCLQPLEAKADMDVRKLGPRCGDRLALMGNIDARVLSTNDADRVEAEIAAKLAAGMATRGYAYHSDHSVPPDVSWSTYRLVVDLLDRYGRYA